MDELATRLQRDLERIDLRPFTTNDFHARREHKRRNQRIAAGVVGLAVFAATVAVALTFGSSDRTQPGASGGAATGPAATATVPPAVVWDGEGLPPEGTPPSLPEEGEVIDRYLEGYGPVWVFVYADGRVITDARTFEFVNERRLTPEGVQLVRSGAVEAEDLLGPIYKVPPSGWAVREAQPFVPSRYAVCYYQESGESNPGTINGGYEYPSRVLQFFPAPARSILRGEVTHGQVDDPASPECSAVTTDEARALDEILGDRRVEDAEGDTIFWELNMILPHGVQTGHCSPCA